MDRPLKEGQDRNLAKLFIGLKLLIKILINFIKLQCEAQHFGSNENDCTTCNFSTLTVHYCDEQQNEPAAVCNKCTVLAEMIRSKHVNRNPNWSNYATATNRQWQLMKCYIEDYGYSEAANVEKAGFKALVQICTNHVDVERAIGNGLPYLLTILGQHDDVIQTKDAHVSDELLHECLTNIEEAIKNIDDPQRNLYLQEIKTLMNDTKHITVQDDMKRCIWVLKTLNRYITTLEHSSSCCTHIATLKEIKSSHYKHMNKICPDIIKDINKQPGKVKRYMIVAEHLFNDTKPEYMCPAEPNNETRNEDLNHWYTHTMLGSISDHVIDINDRMGRISKDVQDLKSIVMPCRKHPNVNETEQGELSQQRVNTGNDSHNNAELRDHQMSPQQEFQLPYQENGDMSRQRINTGNDSHNNTEQRDHQMSLLQGIRLPNQENEPAFVDCKRLVVAAIDIGTTYSCYAYSFSNEFQRDRLQIYANSDWNDGVGMVTCKVPTIVLFDNKGQLHSFGYEAETKYNSLAATDEHIGWRYFRRFKMELFEKTIRNDIKIKDAQDKFMPAIEVFIAAIAFLKNHLLRRLQQRDTGFRETDIDWVLTVPAIWNDDAKQFMMMAAGQAGISENQLSLAYEPEAAAIYCKESFTTLSREQNTNAQLIPFGPGEKFMVIDLGGGTVDITAHEVLADGKLKSLYPPSGGPWGGAVVDKHFNAFIENIFEKDVFKEFSMECASDKLFLDRTIEIRKREMKPTDEKIRLNLPNKLFSFYQEKTHKNIEETLRKGPFKDTVTKKRDKLIVESGTLLAMFNESKNEILAHVDQLLRTRELLGLKKLLLVGGFAESLVIQDAVRQKFDGGYEVMVPQQPELAIVKGAVIYGHSPQSVSFDGTEVMVEAKKSGQGGKRLLAPVDWLK